MSFVQLIWVLRNLLKLIMITYNNYAVRRYQISSLKFIVLPCNKMNSNFVLDLNFCDLKNNKLGFILTFSVVVLVVSCG